MAEVAAKLMHAVQYENYGGGLSGLKHVEIPIPSPKRDEVLVKLEAASLNPADWKIQKGTLCPLVPRKFPFIPGFDVAGEIVEVGERVKKFKAGDKVVAVLHLLDGGGLAEFATATEGAGLPTCGLTAHQALAQVGETELDGTGQLKSILITGASGGVGHYAVQLAKQANAHVTVTCGARNIEFVKRLGADEVLDYSTPDGAALRSPSGQKYDVKLVPLIINAKAENLDYLLKLVKEGKLKTVIDSKHSLSKAEDAWAKSMDGHATGKIILEA
ncbi:putative NADPH:quinone reductase [Rosa chinensis]|uniref:Putative NADPH:quinone reductase n=1 Tax=Rosa chinensis TaxID=74649 RepID=A0A2P6PU30_ROSCH|nr:putative NADPH:quinone reductase [Rosa chinensis]